MTIFKSIPSISPLSFFKVEYPCHRIDDAALLTKKKYKLPIMSEYLGEEAFTEVAIGWHEQNIRLRIEIDLPFEKADLSDYRKKDSVELFFDTRNLKQKTTLGRFCHHFVIFAEKVEGSFGHEVTRFRGDDVHTLCRSTDLSVESIIKPKYTVLEITIPAECLHGFDPERFAKLGFSYRVNVKDHEPQNFSVASNEMHIEKNPSLWSTLDLQ